MTKKININEQHIYKLISSNVKRIRSLQNISQLNLALKTGLTHNFINDIENCKKGVSARTLAKLSTALDVEPYQFFLSHEMTDNAVSSYVRDFNDSLQKVVSDLSQQYLFPEDKG